MEVGAKCQGNARECRGMPGERMGVGVNCQGKAGNAGECQGNVCEWVFSARVRVRESMGVGTNCQGNAGGCRRMPGEQMGVSVKCQGNAGQ